MEGYGDFVRRGKQIYNGKTEIVLVSDVETLQIADNFKITKGKSNVTAVKSVGFARRKSKFFFNSIDLQF